MGDPERTWTMDDGLPREWYREAGDVESPRPPEFVSPRTPPVRATLDRRNGTRAAWQSPVATRGARTSELADTTYAAATTDARVEKWTGSFSDLFFATHVRSGARHLDVSAREVFYLDTVVLAAADRAWDLATLTVSREATRPSALEELRALFGDRLIVTM